MFRRQYACQLTDAVASGRIFEIVFLLFRINSHVKMLLSLHADSLRLLYWYVFACLFRCWLGISNVGYNIMSILCRSVKWIIRFSFYSLSRFCWNETVHCETEISEMGVYSGKMVVYSDQLLLTSPILWGIIRGTFVSSFNAPIVLMVLWSNLSKRG